MSRMTRIVGIVVLAVTAVAATAQDRSDIDALLAPLPIRDQFLLNSGFLFFTPERARVIDAGRLVLSLNAADANTFVKSEWISHSFAGRTERAKALEALSDPRFNDSETLFLVDGQTHRTSVGVHYGMGANLELSASVPFTSVGGGWSDALIENIHRAMKIGNAQRESLRRNSETVYLRNGNSVYVRSRGNGLALGDIAVAAKYELAPMDDHHVHLAVLGALELPTGNARTLDGSGSIDTGLQLIATRDFDHTRIHASLGVLHLGPHRAIGTKSQILVSNTVAIAHRITQSAAATIQLTVSESPFRQFRTPEFSRRAYQLSTGVQRVIGSVVIHAAFIENVMNFENSADAGIAWGISRRF